jgi:hypothetical protein
MTRIAIHQPEHLPWLGYLDKARRADAFIFLDTVAFKKNYFENRNRIRTPQGWAWVTAPVLLKGRFGQAFLDVQINNQARWAEVYYRTLLQNYSRAPFWKTYGPVLEELLLRPWEKLVDLNLHADPQGVDARRHREEKRAAPGYLPQDRRDGLPFRTERQGLPRAIAV